MFRPFKKRERFSPKEFIESVRLGRTRFFETEIYIDGDVDFDDFSLPGNLQLGAVRVNGRLSFRRCVIGSLELVNARIAGTLALENCMIHGDLRLPNVYIGNRLWMPDTHILGKTRLDGLRVSGDVVMSGSTFDGDFDFEDGTVKDTIDVCRSKFLSSYSFTTVKNGGFLATLG